MTAEAGPASAAAVRQPCPGSWREAVRRRPARFASRGAPARWSRWWPWWPLQRPTAACRCNRGLRADVDDGPDVEQLERNLQALGYTGFTVDESYTAATAGAVSAWQQDVGLVELPDGRRLTGVIASVGRSPGPNSSRAGAARPNPLEGPPPTRPRSTWRSPSTTPARQDGATRIVPVKTGLFDGGRVEVQGAGIAVGTRVGVPAP